MQTQHDFAELIKNVSLGLIDFFRDLSFACFDGRSEKSFGNCACEDGNEPDADHHQSHRN